WYYVSEMLNRNPRIRYVRDRRMVSDADVATTTGMTASMPMMLTLLEAIAGRQKAEAVAEDLGIERRDARHASDAIKITRPFATTVLANRIAFWDREELGVRLDPGMDEVSLAVGADAWSRTYRSSVMTVADSANAVVTQNGIRIIPDVISANWPKA